MGQTDAVIAIFADYKAAKAAATAFPAAIFATKNPLGAAVRQPRDVPIAGTVLNFRRNCAIYGECDDADVFFKVVSGVVRTCRFLRDGRRQIDEFHVPGDVFGLEMGAARSLAAEAACDAVVISYRRRVIERLAAGNRAVSHQLFAYAMQNLARAQAHAAMLGQRTAAERLAAFLIDWAARCPGDRTVTLAMTRQDIADYLGLTIETVSRTLSGLQRRALIGLPSARQVVLVDSAGLRALNV